MFSKIFILDKSMKIQKSWILVKKSQARVPLSRLTANANAATVIGSIPASSDTIDFEGQQMMLPNYF